MQQLNLLPDLKLEKRRVERINRVSVIVFVLTLIFFAVVSLGLLGVIVTQQSSKEEQKERYNRAKQEEGNIGRFGVEVKDETTGITTTVHINKAGKDLQFKLETLKKLLGNRLFFKNLLTAITVNVPNGVILDTLSADRQNLQISGTGGNYTDIAKFANSLENYYGEPLKLGLASEIIKEIDGSYFMRTDELGEVLLGSDKETAKAFLAKDVRLRQAVAEAYKKKYPDAKALFIDVKLNGIASKGGPQGFTITAQTQSELFHEEE